MPLAAQVVPRGVEHDAPLVVQVWNRDGVQVVRSQGRREAPARGDPGFATVATRDGPWRVYSVIAAGELVQVAQPLSTRDELAASLALRTIVPWLVAMPLTALLLWFAIARALAPLERVASAVSRRTPRELAPLPPAGWPQEVQPLVDALNGLLARLDAALAAQRTFVADAAHELRTPLTAVHLQAQLAARATDDTERAAALTAMKGGLARATRLAEQLLALARADDAPAASSAPVNLVAVARAVVALQAAVAAARDIDLGLVAPDEAVGVAGDGEALTVLLSNLVDNAVRYTPAGGQVDVVVETRDGRPTLRVRDTGPGIPVAERAQVFERFARGRAAAAPGSGLGLAIVRRIAERHGARVELADAAPDRGLVATVTFPAPGQDAAGTASKAATR
jgi:two-component system OmpR family sensor kinase